MAGKAATSDRIGEPHLPLNTSCFLPCAAYITPGVRDEEVEGDQRTRVTGP